MAYERLRLTSRLAVVLVVVQLVPRSSSRLPFQDRPSQSGSLEQELCVREFVPQCRTRTDIRCDVSRASES